MTPLMKSLVLLAGVGQLVTAQNPGATPEVHPPLPSWKCTTSGGCVKQNTSIVLDWDFRSVHLAGDGTTSCKAGNAPNATSCPDAATCTKNCVVEGIVDYAALGVSTSGSALTMYHYPKVNGKLTNASPRVYLLGPDNNYAMIKLLDQEFTVDVDMSTLPCGENGALYFSEMSASGGRSEHNAGGAAYGAGYCDAQCPTMAWRNGTANPDKEGYCCAEMDILEANSVATAFTPHPCRPDNCDRGGCGFNPYYVDKSYYGPNMTLDTTKPFTVITQFIATNGSLSQITRKYIQNGRAVPSAVSGGDTILASACGSATNFGGLAGMGPPLARGMVLAFSIWNDAVQNMNWLDSGSAGPCASDEGSPSNIVSQHPDTHVVFSNLRWGDIGSTTKA